MRISGITAPFKDEASANKPLDLSPQENDLAVMALAARGVVVRETDKASLMRGVGQEIRGRNL